MKLRVFDTSIEKQKAVKRAQRGKRNKEGSVIGGISVSDWDMTAWANLPREERLRIVIKIQRRYQYLCIDVPKMKMKVQHETSVVRHKADKERKVSGQMQAAVDWHQHKETPVAKTTEALDRMLKVASPSRTAYTKTRSR